MGMEEDLSGPDDAFFKNLKVAEFNMDVLILVSGRARRKRVRQAPRSP